MAWETQSTRDEVKEKWKMTCPPVQSHPIGSGTETETLGRGQSPTRPGFSHKLSLHLTFSTWSIGSVISESVRFPLTMFSTAGAGVTLSGDWGLTCHIYPITTVRAHSVPQTGTKPETSSSEAWSFHLLLLHEGQYHTSWLSLGIGSVGHVDLGFLLLMTTKDHETSEVNANTGTILVQSHNPWHLFGYRMLLLQV